MGHAFKFLKITLWPMKKFFRPHSLRIDCRNVALSSIYCSCRLLFVRTLHPPALTSSCAKRAFRVYSRDACLVTAVKVKSAAHTYTHAFTHAHTPVCTHTHMHTRTGLLSSCIYTKNASTTE